MKDLKFEEEIWKPVLKSNIGMILSNKTWKYI